MPGRQPTISLCTITAGPLHQVAAILACYRPVVDEIVVALNARFRPDELSCLGGLADIVIPVEMGTDFLQERYRAWLYGRCSGERIVTVDSDEVPSVALLSSLRAMAAADDVVTWLVTCRWLYPDPAHYLDEYPWEPSWKMMMVRNDPATLLLKGGVHEGVMAVEPYRYVELPIYHLACVTTSLEERMAKVAFYDGLEGRQLLEDGRGVSEVFYLPERSSRWPPAPLPTSDAAVVKGVLGARTSADRILERQSQSEREPLLDGAVSLADVLAALPDGPLGETAYRARIEARLGRSPKRGLANLEPAEVRPYMVSLTNLGDATWRRALQNRIALSYRFFTCGPSGEREALVLEGGRAPLPSDIHPGETVLLPIDITAPEEEGDYLCVVDLVEEGVCWFEQGLALEVSVRRP
jgi:hypothetical protein